MRRIIVPLVLLIAFGGAIFWRLQQKQAQTAALANAHASRAGAAATVELATVATRDIIGVFEATGTVEAPLEVKLASKVSGRINFLEVHEGDKIRKGQVLVRLDPSQINAQVAQQKANLAEAQYRLAQAQLTQAPTDVSVNTQIRQQSAAVASANADYEQALRNSDAQVAAAEANINDAQGKINSSIAAIANAKASIKSAQANLDNANAKYDRYKALFDKGFIAAQDLDDAKTAQSAAQAALDVANGQLESAMAAHDSAVAQKQSLQQQAAIIKTTAQAGITAAKARLQQAEASLDLAKANTAQTPAYRQSLAALQAQVEAAQASLENYQAQEADTVLKAPLDGVVTGRFMDPGAMATPGQAILAVQFQHQVWGSVAVPEDVSSKLHLGQTETVTFDTYPGRLFQASIVQINPSADPQSRQFTVRVILDNAQNLFKPGMFAKVSLETEHVSNVVAVPREAVKQGESGASSVMVVDQTSKVSSRPVVTGAQDADYIAILSGVVPGEQVVTLSSFPLKDSQTVRVTTPVQNEQTAPQYRTENGRKNRK
jgi:RND family efflux transporter MFP subunit